MNIAFSCKAGILEYTAKVIILASLFNAVESSYEDAEAIFVLNSDKVTGSEKDILIFKEDSESGYLVRVMEVLKQKFKRNLMLTGFENLEWFAECFSVESSDFISNVLLVYKEDRVNFSSMDRTALCELLKKANLFDTTVDEFLGVKLHLYCNKDKLDSYYNWLRYKFSKLYMHKLPKCGKKFFTPSEVDSFYRSLASKLKKLEYTLYNTDIFMMERNNDVLGVTERILFLDVDYISRALNEVILKSEDYPYLIVCCKTSKLGLYSYWKDDKIVHRVVNSKGRMEKIVKYIEFLK